MRGDRINRIVSYALNRPAAYAIVLMVFVASMIAILGHWPLWVVGASIAAGAVLLGLLVADSLSDPVVEQEASLADIDLSLIRDKALKASVVRAIEYVKGAQAQVRDDREGVLASAGDELPEMEHAVRSIFQMALRVQDFRNDALVQRDLGEARQGRSNSRHFALSQSRQEWFSSLEKLEGLVGTAEQEIDEALAHLGQSYVEMKAIKVTPEIKGRTIDALKDLNESTERLSDLARSYDEAFSQRAQPNEPERR